MKWVEVVDVAAVRVVAVVAVKGVAPRPLGQVVTVFAPVVGTRNHTWSDSRATRKSAPSAARRWSARDK